MDIRMYTDENYVPIKDLSAFGNDFIVKTEEYRRTFMEVVSLNGLDFVSLVETPTLVKKRFTKNVELKGVVEIKAENNDFILEIAKSIVTNQTIPGIEIVDREKIIQKYLDNNKDLTIITNYITKNIEQIIKLGNHSNGTLNQQMPELSKLDQEFVRKFNMIKMHYSIQDYQNLNHCSYETGRKALDRLAELKLYIKTKVGKKFVYEPTEKLVVTIKGGE